ncbi:hypothetical protein IXO89_02590 [Xanthomonas oryzae pv. oryzae]|nr:hypothetical protein IXO89_02590 [Xanthomonas oryzae pv. oryzae]
MCLIEPLLQHTLGFAPVRQRRQHVVTGAILQLAHQRFAFLAGLLQHQVLVAQFARAAIGDGIELAVTSAITGGPPQIKSVLISTIFQHSRSQ